MPVKKKTSDAPHQPGRDKRRIDAVLFDLDGVVTDTASGHTAAWQQMFDEFLRARSTETGSAERPFDPDIDYRTYIDGKPRYDGVRDFLTSRGIELPFGKSGDSPQERTICGLGNAKNGFFRAWLEAGPVPVFPGSLRLIAELRAAHVKLGLFTASRNGRDVARRAGLDGLFDVIFDGNDTVELGLAGKPDPAVLLETAARLDVDRRRAVVIEDALAGVTAGAAGSFGLVIGVARDGDKDRLAAHGADIVVGDPAELTFTGQAGLTVKTARTVPSLFERTADLRARLAGRRPAVFLDYDGTLTPIVADFTKAVLAPHMREAVADLAARCTVAVITGRDVTHIKDLVDLGNVLYAGSHGFDIEAGGRIGQTPQIGVSFLPDLDATEVALVRAVGEIAGAAVERKRFEVSVHYRLAAAEDVARVEAAVDRAIADHPRLQKKHGKMVFQIQPRVDWNKGRAVAWLLGELELDTERTMPIYVGDDLTDEDAFRTLAGRGITVVVGDEDRPTSADFSLADPLEVERFLRLIAEIAGAGNGQPTGGAE